MRIRQVGILDRLRQRAATNALPNPPDTVASTPTTISARRLPAGSLLGIVGESHYQAAIIAANKNAQAKSPPFEWLDGFALDVATDEPELCWFDAWLCHEPDNPYDPNAIAVWSLHDGGLGDRLGYLSRDDAPEYQAVFATLREWGFNGAVVPAFTRFGGPAKLGGVVIALSRADFCERALDGERSERDEELARLNRELERLPNLEPAERELARERLAHEASVFGTSWREIADELGYPTEESARAAAAAHIEREGVSAPSRTESD